MKFSSHLIVTLVTKCCFVTVILLTSLMVLPSQGQLEDDDIDEDDAAENRFSGLPDPQPDFGRFWNQGGGAPPPNPFPPWPLQNGQSWQGRPAGRRPQISQNQGWPNGSPGGGNNFGGNNQNAPNRPSIGFPNQSGNNQGNRPGAGSNRPAGVSNQGGSVQAGERPIWNGQSNQNQNQGNVRPEEVEQLWGTMGPNVWGSQNEGNRPESQWGGNRPRPGNQGGNTRPDTTEEAPVGGSQPTFPNMGGNRPPFSNRPPDSNRPPFSNRPPVSNTNRLTTERTTTSRIRTTSRRSTTSRWSTTSSDLTTESEVSGPTTTTLSPCERDCPVTPEFNPVCTVSGNTYSNPGRLRCAQNCGKRKFFPFILGLN